MPQIRVNAATIPIASPKNLSLSYEALMDLLEEVESGEVDDKYTEEDWQKSLFS
jgi:hypothetical protein